MKTVRLKTLEQIEKEFKLFSKSWKHKPGGNLYIMMNGYDWCINAEMFQYFGTNIEVSERKTPNYTHKGSIIGWSWHELWFEPELEDFLKEEEMKI